MKRSALFAMVLLLGGLGESKAGEIYWPLGLLPIFWST
jgi:hypothetical protein